MKNYKGYMIDLDGTVYKGDEVIEEAREFVKHLNAKGIPYLFLTNNSLKTPGSVTKTLMEMDIPCSPENVYTSSMAMASYIETQSPKASIFCIGEKPLKEMLAQKGFTFQVENPQYVVMGIDREINYEKLASACVGVRAGATFLATNPDRAFPTAKGVFLPGNGAFTEVVTASTGVKPTFIGKPYSIIMDQAIQLMKMPKEDIAIIGDNYNTDVLAGIRAEVDAILVLSGVTTREELKQVEVQPTIVVDNLLELMQ